MKKRIVNFSILIVLLFSITTSCENTVDYAPSKNNKIVGVDAGELINIYPNINNGILGVSVNNESDQEFQLFIFDPQGKKIITQIVLKRTSKNFQFDIKSMTNQVGTYHVTLQTPNSTFTQKFIVI